MIKLAQKPDFAEIVQLIENARKRAYQAVNTTLIELYWQVGEYISHKLQAAEWGDGVVDELARHLALTQPNLKGFTRPNLFRMRQFYEIYHQDGKVLPLVRQLPSHPEALNIFKDSCLVDFLGLPDGHSEADLHQGLLAKLKYFLDAAIILNGLIVGVSVGRNLTYYLKYKKSDALLIS